MREKTIEKILKRTKPFNLRFHPFSACEVSPEHQSYTMTLNCGVEVPAGEVIEEPGSSPELGGGAGQDDPEREYAYDDGAEKALQLASEEGWIIVSMQNDWKTVFPN